MPACYRAWIASIGAMKDSIKNILIAGGGTSGWIAAAFLNRFLDPTRCSITLVESAGIGTIGVGEATVPPIVPLLRMLGIEEDDFLRKCHATYKLGIKFVDWNRGAAVGGTPGGKDESGTRSDPSARRWSRACRCSITGCATSAPARRRRPTPRTR